MTQRDERVKKLVSDTLDGEHKLSVSELIRISLRIARLQRDYRNIAWLERELLPFEATFSKNALGAELLNFIDDINEFKPTWDADTERIIEERRLPKYDSQGKESGDAGVLGLSVPDIEVSIEGLTSERDSTKIPDNVSATVVARYDKMISNQRALLTLNINDRRAILNHIRLRVLKYLNQTEVLIAYENLNSDLFEAAKQIVRSELSVIAPDVLAKLNTAEDRLQEGSAESYSHALATCRRVLKSFADSLYPASENPVKGSDGKVRVLGDENYIARLWQYLFELKGRHAGTNITLAVLNQLGERIDSVYKLTNKGVHSDVIDHEAKQCVIQTYLTLCDILAFKKSA